MKIIIFDSSTIINFTMNGLLDVLRNLRANFDGKFIITTQIKRETIDRPLTIKKFELGALRIQKLIDEKTLELPESIGININELNNKTQETLKNINHIFSANNEFINIIHDGEASVVALSLLASKKNIDNIIAIDERTTRMLIEKPENLKKLLKRKLHQSVHIGKMNIADLSKIKVIRSSELVYVAFKKQLVQLRDGHVLDALLYATKFNGSSISDEEIEQIKKIQ